MTEKNYFSLSICIAIILGCFILSMGMGKITHKERTVSVRGLAEKEVDSDMAVWKLGFTVGGNNLPLLQKDVIKNTQIVVEFLKSYGLTETDFSVLAPEIEDATTNMYSSGNPRIFDYVAKQSILVRSAKVEEVKKASGATLELLGKGVSITSNYDNKVTYEFNGLNSIKPEMIAQATQNARLAAEQFAHDSGSKVGKIVTATQGLFSIENAAVGLEDKKNIRVVTTVVYSLKD